MRRLTLKEVNEEHGGVLPADATLRPDVEPAPAARPKRRGGRAERFAVLNAFTDFSLADLTGAEAKVWVLIFRDVKAATGTARTGQADLARRAGLSPRGVRKALVELERKGLVDVVHRGRLNRGTSVYRVHPTGTV